MSTTVPAQGTTLLGDAIREAHPYWKLTLLKDQPLLNWLLVGTVSLVGSYLAALISGEWLHPWLYVYFPYFIVAGIPFIFIHALDLFSEIEPAGQRTFALTEYELHHWLLIQGRGVFGFRSPWMWASGGLIVVLGNLTIITLQHHIRSPLVYWGMLLSGQAVFFLCGHGAYAVLKLMQLQYRFARLPLGLTFLGSGQRAVDAITRPFNFMSFAVLVEYVGLLLAVTLSPFHLVR